MIQPQEGFQYGDAGNSLLAESGGVHIASQARGDADLGILLSPGFVSHLEHSWEDPSMARFCRCLASFARLIVFDKRGTGMSDPTPDDRPGLLEDPGRRHRHLDGHGGIGAGGDHGSIGDRRGRSPVRCHTPGANESGDRVRLVVGDGDKGPIYPWAPDPAKAALLEHLEQHWGRGVLYLQLFAPSLVGDSATRTGSRSSSVSR